MNAMRHPYAGTGDHTGSYYAASANPAPLRAELAGTHETDIAVLGAGYSGLSTALHLAEQIRRQIAASGADQSHEYVPVTISCGVSRFEPDDSLQSVFKRADQALYQAKRDGRNCCRVGRNDTRFGVHTS